MTDTEINIAIAEAIGITQPQPIETVDIDSRTIYTVIQERPDYCHDLNACHEAEKTLLLPSGVMPSAWYINIRKCALEPERASAHQRAEAFLRCLGRWVD